MSGIGKVLRGVLALVVAIGLGTIIGWLVSRHGDVAPVMAPDATNATVAIATQPVPTPVVQPTEADATQPKSHELRKINAFANQMEQNAPDWEQRLDDILLGDDDENGKADKILALIPRAPADAQQELAQHLVNMVQDDHYDGTAELLTNAATSPDVSNVLMNDLLNRGNTLKLPMLLAIARNNDHPLKDQALDLLGLLTQEDKGTNWDEWSTTVDTWLQNNQ
jgi:hypothetical protein